MLDLFGTAIPVVPAKVKKAGKTPDQQNPQHGAGDGERPVHSRMYYVVKEDPVLTWIIYVDSGL